MITATNTQSIQLIEGHFNPTEASEILRTLIKAQENCNKVLKWSAWEKDHGADYRHYDEKVAVLNHSKEEGLSRIREANLLGQKVTVRGTIEITIED